jgi:hypothetical protein
VNQAQNQDSPRFRVSGIGPDGRIKVADGLVLLAAASWQGLSRSAELHELLLRIRV